MQISSGLDLKNSTVQNILIYLQIYMYENSIVIKGTGNSRWPQLAQKFPLLIKVVVKWVVSHFIAFYAMVPKWIIAVVKCSD